MGGEGDTGSDCDGTVGRETQALTATEQRETERRRRGRGGGKGVLPPPAVESRVLLGTAVARFTHM